MPSTPAVPKNNIMLTYVSQLFKSCPTQSSYNHEISLLILASCECPYCKTFTLIFFGTYVRHLLIDGSDDLIKLRIQRVQCTTCKRTHAILPDCLLVRSSFLLHDALFVIEMDEDEIEDFLINNPKISLRMIISLKSRVFRWSKLHKISILEERLSFLFKSNICFELYQHKNDSYFAFNI